MNKSSFKRSLAMFLAILMFVTSFPILAYATDESGIMPSPGTTKNQPFKSGEPSPMYRIPAMVSLDDGTIVAAVDARWNGGMDGGGNDTMIARSTDGGSTWSNYFATYYPDNGNEFNKASTSVCDTELATDGKNIYMLTVFFPAGYALNAASANNQLKNNNGIAFYTEAENAELAGRLKLSYKGNSTFEYYLGDFDAAGADGRAPILKNDGTETGYFADHDYYLYNGTNKSGGNLFYSDGQYQTAKVNFLLFRKSTDGGLTWSDFTPLNMKNSSEAFFGVGPGRGVVDENGRIYFSTYTWSTHWLGANDTQRSSFIFSDDDGLTWKRTPDCPDLPAGLGDAGGTTNTKWSSESSLVQMNNGVMRCFVRNAWGKVIYFDATYDAASDNYVWSSYVDCEFRTANNSGCQLSAIRYSEELQYNGKYYTAVLISTPTSGSGRTNGKVYTLLFDDDNNPVNINNKYNQANNKNIEYSITSGQFEYSCLTEMPDGTMKVLYEVGNGIMVFETLPNITKLTGLRVPEGARTLEYAMARGDERTFYTDSDNAVNSDESVTKVTFAPRKGVKATTGDSAAYDGESIWLKDALYDFTKNPDGTWNLGAMGVYMTVVQPGLPSSVTKDSVTIKQDGEYFKFVDAKNEALAYWRDNSSGKINQFDQTTAYGNDGGAGANSDIAADRDREMTLFEVYRPARVDEAVEGTLIPGFVRVTDMNELKDGGQYLIGCEVNGAYYFIYPSTSTDNTYSHSVKVAKNAPAEDAGFFMTVKALKVGVSKVVVSSTERTGETTYLFTVSDYSNEILGVVDYDPVIYTHGSASVGDDMNFTYVGNIISDGEYEGERYTEYRFRTVDGVDLSKEYSIVGVTALLDDTETQSADIRLTNDDGVVDGKLHGTLSLAGTKEYVPYTAGTYVILKTTLKDNEGVLYTQTDKLYVASNPVPGHVISGVCRFESDNRAQICTYLLAPQSVGNTVDSKSMGYGYGGYNAKHIFSWSRDYDYGDTSHTNEIMTFSRGFADFTQINASNQNMIKGAGIAEHAEGLKSWIGSAQDTENTVLTEAQANQYTLAYYYYDLSSDKNWGIDEISVNRDTGVADFSVALQRKLVDVEREAKDKWTNHDVKIGAQVNGQDRTYIEKLSGDGTIERQSYMYGAAGTSYRVTSFEDRRTEEEIAEHEKPLNVICQATVGKNEKASLKGVFRYQEGNDAAKVWNDMRLPFEILLCDKSNERAAYEKTIEHVLKSTDYTTTTWKRYMDSVLIYQEYLNNYILRSTGDEKTDTGKTYSQLIDEAVGGTGAVDNNFDKIQKSATFPLLRETIDEGTEIINSGIMLDDGNNYTPDSFLNFVNICNDAESFYTEGGENNKWVNLDPEVFDTPDEVRAETPGYEVGPYPDLENDRLPVQIAIDNNIDAINTNKPKPAGDDSAYEAAKAEANNIDKTAYTEPDNVDTIVTGFNESDDVLYKEFIYNETNYGEFLNISADEQSAIDFETAKNLENMEVAKDKNNLRHYNLTFKVNDEVILNADYPYGYTYDLPLAEYMTDENIVKCVINTVVDSVKTPTTVNLKDYEGAGYVLPVLIQEDIEINLTVTPKSEKTVTVVDYYGTVIGVLSGETLTVKEDTVTVDGISVSAKMSPKFTFTGWTMADGEYSVTESIVIAQKGNFNASAHTFYVENGTVNSRTDKFNVGILNEKLILESPTAQFWTRQLVDNDGNPIGNEILASYESSFINFSSNEDVKYKAYDSVDALPADLQEDAQQGIPVVYGTGYVANNKFTLSVDYSAPINSDKIKVLDSGVILSTAMPDEGLVKGSAGSMTVAANRIAHWSDSANSGTFTMSAGNADQKVYYMRAYVSYTATYVGIDKDGKETEYTLPYVVYSDKIYKCDHGTVSIAE